MKEYKVVEGYDVYGLASNVINELFNGLEPHGNMVVIPPNPNTGAPERFLQPMYRSTD